MVVVIAVVLLLLLLVIDRSIDQLNELASGAVVLRSYCSGSSAVQVVVVIIANVVAVPTVTATVSRYVAALAPAAPAITTLPLLMLHPCLLVRYGLVDRTKQVTYPPMSTETYVARVFACATNVT